MRSAAALSIVLLALSGCVAPAPASPDAHVMEVLGQMQAFPVIVMETDEGTIELLLYQDWLPGTSAHIQDLVEAGFYDGLLWHRVVDDFVIQGGDPTGTGEGGSGPAGTSDMIPLEIKEGLDFGSGAVGLARWTDDTGDSQLFITEKPALHLSRPSGATGDVFGAYALFAQVTQGLDVVRRLAAVPTLPNDRPIEDTHIISARMAAPSVDLFNVIKEVHAVDGGHLEVPRYAVAGHPMHVIFTGDDGCPEPPTPMRGPALEWVASPDDACTFEATAVAVPGEWALGPATVSVHPWHDAYAPFTGTDMNRS